MAGQRSSNSSKDDGSNGKSSSKPSSKPSGRTSKSKSKPSSSSRSSANATNWVQSTEEVEDYPEDPVTPKPIQDPYPDGPPKKPDTTSQSSRMPTTRHDQSRLMTECSTAEVDAPSYVSAYSSDSNQAVHYQPTYRSGYANNADSTSMDTPIADQEQYSNSQSYQGYENSGRWDSEKTSDSSWR